jgi:hypothetical protein
MHPLGAAGETRLEAYGSGNPPKQWQVSRERSQGLAQVGDQRRSRGPVGVARDRFQFHSATSATPRTTAGTGAPNLINNAPTMRAAAANTFQCMAD